MGSRMDSLIWEEKPDNYGAYDGAVTYSSA